VIKNWHRTAIDENTKDDHVLKRIEETSNPEERKQCPSSGCPLKPKTRNTKKINFDHDLSSARKPTA